jgi:heptosyltransferase-2
MKKILVIQTAFIGDAILGTSVLEKLHQYYPDAQIDYLVRKGNESICNQHPYLNRVIVFDKSQKYKNLWKLIKTLRTTKYDYAINLQRFFTTGLMTVLSGAKQTIGFDKNPLSFLFSKSVKHEYSSVTKIVHEVERNQKLIAALTDEHYAMPKLYTQAPKLTFDQAYVCVAPYSIWFTKQYPLEKWIQLIQLLQEKYTVCLMGAPSDLEGCERIKSTIASERVVNLAGQLNLLESAAMMKSAVMTFANDSAPLHLASAVNANVVALFCSTVPAFGFTPLSDRSWVFETEEKLSCKPCGLHGKKECPEGHFKCGNIDPVKIIQEVGL